MGLELIELAMLAEDAFEIDIPDEDTYELFSPRKYADYVYTRCGDHDYIGHQPCRTQVKFHHLRRTLMTEFGVVRNEVKLQTSIDDIMPKTLGRLERQHWHSHLEECVGVSKVNNVSQLIDFIPFMEMPAGYERKLTSREVLEQMMELTVKALYGLRLGSFNPDSHFIIDLGAG